MIHASDWLKHGHLLIETFLEYGSAPEIRVEQRMQFERETEFLHNIAGAGQLGDARPLGSLVAEVLIQVAVCAQEREKTLMILFGQTFIQRALPDALREQFRDMAARVVDHLTLLDRVSTKCL